MRDTHVASSVVDVLRIATDGGARELLRVVLDEAPGAAGGCAVVGAVDGARAADLFGEVEDGSLGRRRDAAALAFDETNFDDFVLDMERVLVLSLVLFDPAFAGRMDERACDLWPRSLHPRTLSKVWSRVPPKPNLWPSDAQHPPCAAEPCPACLVFVRALGTLTS